MKEIKVYIPASVSNVGPGFDILGFALEHPGEELTLRKSSKNGITITRIIGDEGKLTYDPTKNTATISLSAFLKSIDYKGGFEVEIYKNIPIGGGLGSSAASACATVFAANKLLGCNLSPMDLIEYALAGEKFASGSYHCDNVAPSLLGGFVLVRSCKPLDIITLDAPKSLLVSVLSSNIEIKTQQAREILPKKVPLSLAVNQSANLASLVVALLKGNMSGLKNSLQDYLIEPHRASLIPSFYEVVQAAKDAGALGCGISGSGPSIFAFSDDLNIAKGVSHAMKLVYQRLHIESCVYTSKINFAGPQIKYWR